LNKIIWYLIHCSIGDTMILLIGFALASFFHRGISWIYDPRAKHYLIITIFGVFYTLISEYINVHVKQN
jgi:hypothetical protein